MKEGKVYMAEQAAAAIENFFRKGNLIALRELALRRTADRVDEQMQVYRQDKGIKDIWPAGERILVCVGHNPRSIRLIHAARRLAAGLRAEWLAVHVEAPSRVRPSEADRKQLADHMRLAESLGAETATLSSQSMSEEVLTYARSRNVSKIIIGKPTMLAGRTSSSVRPSTKSCGAAATLMSMLSVVMLQNPIMYTRRQKYGAT